MNKRMNDGGEGGEQPLALPRSAKIIGTSHSFQNLLVSLETIPFVGPRHKLKYVNNILIKVSLHQ